MRENNRNSIINEVIDINGSKIFVENGEVKTILREGIQQGEYMDIEEAFNLIREEVKMIYATKKNSYQS